jgi:hydroxyacylglutathione hydrolase
MEIVQIYTESPLRNFSYLIIGSQGSICVDPLYPEQVFKELEARDVSLTAIVNTHEHPDHTGGNDSVAERTGAPIWAHQNAKGMIPGVSRLLAPGEVIEIDEDAYLEVMDTPGHTHAHLCLKLVDHGKTVAVFTGDTLFNAGVGNCYSGSVEDMYSTIKDQFWSLPDETQVFPGHEYWENNLGFTKDREPENEKADEVLEQYQEKKDQGGFLVSTIALEREVNTFFRVDSKSVKDGVASAFGMEDTPDEKTTFFKLRELRNQW